MLNDIGNQKLPRFRAGLPLLEQVTAERLNDICAMIEASRLQNGVGYTMNRSAGGIFSRVCNVFAGTLQNLCVNGKPAYKAALFNGKCFYAERGENGFEDRRIAEAAEFTRTDLEFEKSAILETLDTLPTTFQMVQKFAKATYNWAKSGFKLADEPELGRRKSICNKCNFWYPTARMGLGKCLKCGCSSAKLKLASEKCPIGKW